MSKLDLLGFLVIKDAFDNFHSYLGEVSICYNLRYHIW